MKNTRRGFLKSTGGLMAGSAVLATAREQLGNLTLPLVPFGQHKVSRLIIGCNQFYGYSHFNNLLSTVMREWCTSERVCEILRRCEDNGINTWQAGAGGRMLADVQRHRADGGEIQVLLVATDSVEETVRTMRPLGIAHHGEVTDVCFREGRMEVVHEFTKKVRQAGVRVGISTHKPEVIEYVEEKGWDVDYYMACAYNRTRTADEFRKMLGELPVPANEVYLEQDPDRMFKVVRKTARTCLIFKILAAGRLADSPGAVDEVFRHVFASIKPEDCVIVGMFPLYKDEVKENADRVRRIVGGLT